MPCPYCGEKQYLTSKSRKRSSLPVFIIPFLIFIPYFFDISLFAVISIYAGVGIGIMCIYPLLIELSNQEEALW
jgi:CXXC-20-CXXC protein